MNDENERSVASAGSVSEPAAWGVMRVGGGWRCIVDNERQAASLCKGWDRAENWVHEAIPLYRSPTLTDAERGAIAYFASIDGPQYLPRATDEAATLRLLLERMK